jgi:NAD dependent epimerase/dehydratase family enzyme
MNKTILITGATGLIGSYISQAIVNRGDEFIALSTDPETARRKLPGACKIAGFGELDSLKDEKIDAVINLAGANLGSKRWNEKTKKEVSDSRINTTRRLVELIS